MRARAESVWVVVWISVHWTGAGAGGGRRYNNKKQKIAQHTHARARGVHNSLAASQRTQKMVQTKTNVAHNRWGCVCVCVCGRVNANATAIHETKK